MLIYLNIAYYDKLITLHTIGEHAIILKGFKEKYGYLNKDTIKYALGGTLSEALLELID